MDFILNYLGQASTWRGLFGILTAFGVIVKPEMASAIIAAGMGIIGLINVIRNEKA